MKNIFVNSLTDLFTNIYSYLKIFVPVWLISFITIVVIHICWHNQTDRLPPNLVFELLNVPFISLLFLILSARHLNNQKYQQTASLLQSRLYLYTVVIFTLTTLIYIALNQLEMFTFLYFIEFMVSQYPDIKAHELLPWSFAFKLINFLLLSLCYPFFIVSILSFQDKGTLELQAILKCIKGKILSIIFISFLFSLLIEWFLHFYGYLLILLGLKVVHISPLFSTLEIVSAEIHNFFYYFVHDFISNVWHFLFYIFLYLNIKKKDQYFK